MFGILYFYLYKQCDKKITHMSFHLKNTTNLIQAPLFFLWDFHPKFICHLYVLKDTEYAKDNEKEIHCNHTILFISKYQKCNT